MTEPETQLTLQEQLESLILVHRQANWDKNLGQYRSEHKCECGYTFVSNGHIEDSNVRVLMAEHISVQILDLFTQALTSLKTEMEKKRMFTPLNMPNIPEPDASVIRAEIEYFNRGISERLATLNKDKEKSDE